MALSAASSLKLDKILNMVIRQLALRLAPLTRFSHTFQTGDLALDKTVRVPVISLEQMASKDFDEDVGYEDGDFDVTMQPVTVDRRKYQSLSFTSRELIGLPLDVLAEGMAQKTDRLAADIVTDILGLVTAANFGDPIYTGGAAGFDSDEIVDIDEALTTLLWPSVGRALILDNTYTTPLKKDQALKNASASGSDMTLREGVVGRVSGFDLYDVPGFPANGENLKGVAALQSGILIANAPIAPSSEVMSQLSDYRVVTDPKTNLTLTYKAWGDPNLDKGKRIVEVSYGCAKGDAQQIKRVTSA
ncbi:MAG TPA: hypothetical protein VGO11_19655 [Chthoniobacteraceae bacterium]|jgi:hypothetical protein|nr:hypothetical protein [Chthoniobacteraceae bacterium]